MARNKAYDPDWHFLRDWLHSMAGDEEYPLVEEGEVPEGFEFLKSISLNEEDIGLTRIDCSLCHYTRTGRNGAAPMFCPMCRSVLLFIDVTPEMFNDDENKCLKSKG